MLKLERPVCSAVLDDTQRKTLTTYQAETTKRVRTGKAKISSRWDSFRSGKACQGVFATMWFALTGMASEKCSFCETSGPSTVEHLHPKGKHPELAFCWENLLAACGDCNRFRENSKIETFPIDPSAVEPLDYFGWDELDGSFVPRPECADLVEATVAMNALQRFNYERSKNVKAVRALLVAVVRQDPVDSEVSEGLRTILCERSAQLGPVREYLLRPPTDDDETVIGAALDLLPEIRTWVAAWLRPPTWASGYWQNSG